MKTSESISKIIPALLLTQESIKFAPKDNFNTYHKSKYADLQSVIESIKPSLNSNGIVFLQDSGSIREINDGVWIISITTRLIHSSSEWIETTAEAPLKNIDPQGVGSAITYLRRYSLSAMCGLYQADDDGNSATINQNSKEIPKHKNNTSIDSMIKKIELEEQASKCKTIDELENWYLNLPNEDKGHAKIIGSEQKKKILSLKEER